MKKLLGRLANQLTEVGGPDGAFTAARRLGDRGRLQDAVEAYADAERMYRDRGGPSGRWVVAAIAGRARCLVELGRFSDGAAAYEAASAARALRDDQYEPTVAQLEQYLADARNRAAQVDSTTE